MRWKVVVEIIAINRSSRGDIGGISRSGRGDVGSVDNIGAEDDVGSDGDVGWAVLADEADIALADMDGASNVGGKGKRGSTALLYTGEWIVMPLICTARLAQLLKQ